MAIEELRKSQWDRLFRVVQAAGFTPGGDVVRTEVDGDVLGFRGGTIPALVHRDTAFYFAMTQLPSQVDRFVARRGPLGIAFAPGSEQPDGTKLYVSFEDVEGECAAWLARVREDTGPDLWQLAAGDQRLLGPVAGIEDLENTPFTVPERERVAASLDALREELVRNRILSAKEIKALGAAIADLKTASERLGRKDWAGILYGTLFGYALTVALAPDQARTLIALAGHFLGWIVGGAPLLPR